MASHSHKRETNARLFTRTPRTSVLAGSLAVAATATAVSLGILTSGVGGVTAAASLESAVSPAVSGPSAGDSTTAALDLAGDTDRRVISRGGSDRGADRGRDVAAAVSARRDEPSEIEKLLAPEAVRTAIRNAELVQFTTEALNLWSAPGDDAELTGELEAGSKVTLTGRALEGREEIVTGRTTTRWVTSGYFADEKPPEGPTLGGDCTNGTSVPSGVSPNIVAVHEAVCANFPDITTYGTFRSDGEHAQGIAVDIMVSGDEGYAVAEFIRANASALGVNYLIYSQRIWSVDRSSEGWRGMEDRGSTTANHYDHVHVTTY